MAFRDIVGQEQALQVLQRALTGTRLAHAYLFHGPSGVGKKHAALQFTKALYCQSAATDACEACLPCRKIAAGNHPDVLLVAPEDTTLKIEQIRALQHRLAYKPYEAQRTTILLDGCEYLTPPAANALLKTLEEPPAGTLLILLTGNKAALPLTIISRCQLVRFQPLAPMHLYTILTQQGIDTATATLASTLLEGRVDRFYHEDFTHTLALRQRTLAMLEDISLHKGMTWFLRARQIASKREQCEELLHWLMLLCRDLTILKVAPNAPVYNHDFRVELTTLAHRLSLECLFAVFALLKQLRTYLGFNGNPQLIFEQCLIHLQQTFTATTLPPR